MSAGDRRGERRVLTASAKVLHVAGEALWHLSDLVGWAADRARDVEVAVSDAGHALFGAGTQALEATDVAELLERLERR